MTWPLPTKLKLRIFAKVSVEGKGRAMCVCRDFATLLRPVMRDTIATRMQLLIRQQYRHRIRRERNNAAFVSKGMKNGELVEEMIERLVADDDVEFEEYDRMSTAVSEITFNRGRIVYKWNRKQLAALDSWLYDGPDF